MKNDGVCLINSSLELFYASRFFIAFFVLLLYNCYKKNNKSFNFSPKRIKLKLFLLFFGFGITLLMVFVGVLLAKLGDKFKNETMKIIGFCFLGIGLGGFFLLIACLAISSAIKEKNNKRQVKLTCLFSFYL